MASVWQTCSVATQRNFRANGSTTKLKYLFCVQQFGKPPLHRAAVRDYYAEILASLDSALTNWNVRHLTLWGELVEVQAPESVPTEADMEAMEEATLAAQFQEVRSKISNLAPS